MDVLRPEYRIRLFLAVDLAGSTAYKASQKNNGWIKTFRDFYNGFVRLYRANYVAFCEEHEECATASTDLPKLWKTVGDEVIFVNRVSSLFQLYAYVHSFDRTLDEYKKTLGANLKTADLDVKGNGWVASFPFPNQTIKMEPTDTEQVPDSLPNEAEEAAADQTPSDYEFLGPGIDAGFRIATNSRPDLLTLSPALAHLLCRANTNRDYKNFKFRLVFQGVNSLKGVVKGADYPIIGINTERDPSKSELVGLQATLSGIEPVNPEKLIEYLESFMAFHKIEVPVLKLRPDNPPLSDPKFYTETFLPDWEKQRSAQVPFDESVEESLSAGSAQEADPGVQGPDPMAVDDFIQDLVNSIRRRTDR